MRVCKQLLLPGWDVPHAAGRTGLRLSMTFPSPAPLKLMDLLLFVLFLCLTPNHNALDSSVP